MDALGTSESSMRSGKAKRSETIPTYHVDHGLFVDLAFGISFSEPTSSQVFFLHRPRCAKLNSPPLVALLRLEQLVRSPFVDDRGEELYANPRLERFGA